VEHVRVRDDDVAGGSGELDDIDGRAVDVVGPAA
jgi:hypothetical protein